MRCVIADDSTIMRGEYKAYLTRAGHSVVEECTCGRDAVDACARQRPDLVVLDIVMPPMNGNEAAALIMDAGTAKYVLMATGNGQDAIVQPLLARGARALIKPFHEPKFNAKIAEFHGEPD